MACCPVVAALLITTFMLCFGGAAVGTSAFYQVVLCSIPDWSVIMARRSTQPSIPPG